jgi:hypothetical protein
MRRALPRTLEISVRAGSAMALGLLLTACRSTSNTAQSAAGTATPKPSAAAGSSAGGSPARPPVASIEPGLGPIGGSDPARFPCGSSSCKAQEHTCCDGIDRAVCVATVPAGENDQVQPLAAQLEVCAAALGSDDLQYLARCDESKDCGDGAVCCSQAVHSGLSSAVCVPTRPDGKTPCDFGEICLKQAGACRVAGTECMNGECRKRLERLRCGSSFCGPGNSCCGDFEKEAFSLRCQPHAQCQEGGANLRCAKPADCLEGETCWYANGNSRCSTYSLDGVAGLVCTSDADCLAHELSCPGNARRRCGPADPQISHIKICGC